MTGAPTTSNEGCQRDVGRTGSRDAWAALAGAALLLTAGCSQRIELPGLTELTDDIVAKRRVVLEGGKMARSFPIEDQDVLVFSPEKGTITLETVEPTRLPDGWRGATLTLQKNRHQAAIPIWAALSYGALKISVTYSATTDSATTDSATNVTAEIICFKNDSGADPIADDCQTTIALEGDAAALPKKIYNKEKRLLARLEVEPRPSPYVMPGDGIDVTLDWYMKFDTIGLAGLYQFSDSRQVTVGADGKIPVPRLRLESGVLQSMECDRFPGADGDLTCSGGRPSRLPSDGRAFSRERAVAAALEANDSLVSLWRSDGKRIHLWKVEWCLNFVGWKERGLANGEAEKECRALGIGEAFLPGPGKPDYFWPRYSLRAEAQTWTLVDKDGVAHSLPLLAGAAIEEQVRMAYARLKGRVIDTLRGINGTAPFLVVVPADGSPAFFGQTAPGGKVQPLDNVALINGDRVFVTSLQPRASED